MALMLILPKFADFLEEKFQAGQMRHASEYLGQKKQESAISMFELLRYYCCREGEVCVCFSN